MKKMFIALCIAMPLTAFAGDKPHIEDVQEEITQITIMQSQCHDNALDNLSMKNCESNAAAQLDQLLNREYKAIVNNKSNFDQDPVVLEEAFRQSQRSWLKFREDNCSWKSNSMYGGTGQGLIYTGCTNGMTKKRIVEMVEEYYFQY